MSDSDPDPTRFTITLSHTAAGRLLWLAHTLNCSPAAAIEQLLQRPGKVWSQPGRRARCPDLPRHRALGLPMARSVVADRSGKVWAVHASFLNQGGAWWVPSAGWMYLLADPTSYPLLGSELIDGYSTEEPIFLVTGPRNFETLLSRRVQVVGLVGDVVPWSEFLEPLWPFEVRIWRSSSDSRTNLTKLVEVLSSRPGQSLATSSQAWELVSFWECSAGMAPEETRRAILGLPAMRWRPIWSAES